MAQYYEDIVDVELEAGSFHRCWLNRAIGMGDEMANRFGVRLFRNGAAEDISGKSCVGYMSRPNGTNLQISGSTYTEVDGNTAYVILPDDAYAYEGPFTLAIKVTGGGVTSTVRIVDGLICNTNTSNAVTPT